jgi:hypothetical protein
VVITNAAPFVNVYLDGVLELTTPETSVMNVGAEGLMHFFLDDSETTGEYSDARIALLRAYRGVLTDSQVAALAADPFTSGPGALTIPPQATSAGAPITAPAETIDTAVANQTTTLPVTEYVIPPLPNVDSSSLSAAASSRRAATDKALAEFLADLAGETWLDGLSGE